MYWSENVTPQHCVLYSFYTVRDLILSVLRVYVWSLCSPGEVFLSALTGLGGESRGVAFSFDTERRVFPFPETLLLAHNALLPLGGDHGEVRIQFKILKHTCNASMCVAALPAGLWAARGRSPTQYTDGGRTAWSPLWPAPSLTCSWCGQTHCEHTDTKWIQNDSPPHVDIQLHATSITNVSIFIRYFQIL